MYIVYNVYFIHSALACSRPWAEMPSRHPTHMPGAGQETLMVYNKWLAMVIRTKHPVPALPPSIHIDMVIDHLPASSVDELFPHVISS